jgi:hypothetical protein
MALYVARTFLSPDSRDSDRPACTHKNNLFNLKDMIFRFSVSFSTVWKASNLGGDSSVYEQILSIMLIFALKFNYYDTSGQGRDQR